MKTIEVSVFLPIYNEANVITSVVEDAIECLKSVDGSYELILVNDGSTDNTLSILKDLEKKHKNIRVVDHVENKGYGAAINTGLNSAKYDWVFFMDSDGQFNLSHLIDFLPYTDSADLVIGYREKRNDKKARLLLAKTYRMLVKLLFGLAVTDIDCAYKLMNKHKMSELKITSTSFFVSTEMLCKAQRKGHKIVELPVKHYPRTLGKSSVNIKRSLESLKELYKLYYSVKNI